MNATHTATRNPEDETMNAKIHPILEREIGRCELEITLCNGNYHGRLIEDGETIWTSRGEFSVAPIHAAAENFLMRLPDSSRVVEIK